MTDMTCFTALATAAASLACATDTQRTGAALAATGREDDTGLAANLWRIGVETEAGEGAISVEDCDQLVLADTAEDAVALARRDGLVPAGAVRVVARPAGLARWFAA